MMGSMHERCATCGRTEDGVVPLYACACGRTVCREHRLSGGGCKACAPAAFAAHERERAGGRGIAWRRLGPQIWGGVGLALCGLAAYTVLERGAPKYYLLIVALLALGALLKVLPEKS